MKVRMFYTDGSEDRANGRRAKALLRPMLQDAGFDLNDAINLKPGEWLHRDGTTLSCNTSIRGYHKMLDCYDESSGHRWDRFAVAIK